MIRVPTVLILGAGASIPFGFPSGTDLKKRIYQGIKKRQYLYSHLKNAGFNDAEMDEFAELLWNSQVPSIDSFLEHNADMAEIGKCCIYIEIQVASAGKEIHEPNWYGDFWQALIANSTSETFSENKVSVVTFNENFLGHAIVATYRKCSAEQRTALLNAIPIEHVYGRIELKKGENVGEAIFNRTKEIKIIHDDEKGSEAQLEKMRNLIRQAHRICILGFGFHETNVCRLGIHKSKGENLLADKVSYATCYGFTNAELWQLRKYTLQAQHLYVGSSNWDNQRVIREFGVFMPDTYHPAGIHRLNEMPLSSN